MSDFEKNSRPLETQEQKDREIYEAYIKSGVEFALAKIFKDSFDIYQAVYLATQSLRLPDRDAFRRVRTLIEKDVRKEVRALRDSEALRAVFKELDTDEQLRDLAEHEALNTTEEERREREEE
ncbi:hypothetical protein KJ673_03125 [Patescibacteria group bacterium]|nr:hypothetical protein [Patescibacteria group bacterium]MBU4453019.1 hypothetical protein [Patescibacteria group bacterium]MCG2687786.1 hypothetical protein [Candidatus Parcubacteria bacterium]